VPAKIPLGMTEREWAAALEADERERVVEEDRRGVTLRGLDGEGWREVRDALPSVPYARR
jgi:hypothetical protein